MREILTREKLLRFMEEIGRSASADGRIYLTGGASALLRHWRSTTIDIDLKPVPEQDSLFRAIPRLKESLSVNVELAAPSDFIPELSGWENRSLFISRHGRIDFHHYDFYSQALSKIERGHRQDTDDVQKMLSDGLVEREKLSDLFESIVSELYRYPAIDPPTFEAAVKKITG